MGHRHSLFTVIMIGLILAASSEVLPNDNPRNEIMLDTKGTGLGKKGIIISSGPGILYTRRTIHDFSNSVSGPGVESKGPSNILYGINSSIIYDLADLRGINHIMPGAGINIYPFQAAYYYDYSIAPFYYNHYQLILNLYYGRSTPKWFSERQCIAAGPTLNLLLWQEDEVLQRLSWGFGVDYFYIIPWKKECNILFSAIYKFETYTNLSVNGLADIDEYHHTFALNFGLAY